MFPWWPLVSWIADSRLARWLAATAAGVALAFGMLWRLRVRIRSDVEAKQKLDRLESAIKADERMDHADIGDGASDDDNREWLRRYAARRRKPRA